MENNLITIHVEDREGVTKELEVPTDINLSLMEILKGSGYEILATCGGIALCATCHVEVLNGADSLPEPEDNELDMLDTLPDADDDSRLSCQLRLTDKNEGLKIKIRGSLQ